MVVRPENYNPYADERRVDLTFTFGIIAPEAAETAVPASSAQSWPSQIAQTHDGVDSISDKWAALEGNLWLLDGTFQLLTPDVSDLQTGWQGDAISGDDGTYPNAPWLEFTFPEGQDSYGFTLLYDDKQPESYPASVTAAAYDETGNLLGAVDSAPAGPLHIIYLSAQGYRRVRFTFMATRLPHRRVRVCQVRFGVNYTYDRTTLSGVTVRQSVSPWCENLPTLELTATVDNQDQLYNMINPEGLYAYLQDGQFMEWQFALDGTVIPMGKTYFTEAESQDGGLTASLTFHDWLYVLDDVPYTGAGSGTWTLQEAVSALLTAADNGKEAVFEDGAGVVLIANTIPENTGIREALRLCAQAAMTACYVDRADRLHFFRPAVSAAADRWTRDVQHEDAQVVVGQLYNVVQLTVGETVYTAKNVAEGDMERVHEVSNPCVATANGQAAADWLLAWVQRRVSYEVTVRGNPGLELLDTVQIDDIYGVNGLALVTQLDYDYDGGLTCDAEAIR